MVGSIRSMTRTSSPRHRSWSTTWDPMNPAPPVTRTFTPGPLSNSPLHHAEDPSTLSGSFAEFIGSLASQWRIEPRGAGDLAHARRDRSRARRGRRPAWLVVGDAAGLPGRSSSTTARPTAPAPSPLVVARSSSPNRRVASDRPAGPVCWRPIRPMTSCASWMGTAPSTPATFRRSRPMCWRIEPIWSSVPAAQPIGGRGRSMPGWPTPSSPPS